ncbi:hypothetical protein [Desulfonatronospira sp.]|uniref:hypothetical protein n=1 Tax=Desulfonatronospira sp. TaxID=1962951 RepID=UPI0025C442AA|nr:hypothetical protein [Desulfonatronospira sp.]
MSEEIKLELKKPLDKMTAKELRQLCIEKIPQITGASGKSKEELLTSIKEVLGMTEESSKTGAYKEQIISLKGRIKELQTKRLETPKSRRKERDILRKKIHNLRKNTRRLAAT